MPSAKYLIQRLLKLDYKRGLSIVKKVHKRTGRNSISIIWDMWQCAKKYGAGYMDYDQIEMDSMTDEQRDTCLTRGRNNDLMKKYNNAEYVHFFDNKDEFVTTFSEFMHRDILIVQDVDDEALNAFLEKHPVFLFKPASGFCGYGIEKLDVKDYPKREELLEHLRGQEGRWLVEEPIRQHEEVAKVYPLAINTARVVTILKEGTPHVICAYFRIGNRGKFVDNFNNDGLATPIDEVTGIVHHKAIDKDKNIFVDHPMTGTPIVGFKFPDWDKALTMVKEAAKKVPQMGYIGWDVAFTPDGPCLIEGNNFPGHDIYQLPVHTPDRIGIYPKFINL